MAKSKTKFDAKDFLLRKGEVLAMGVAGFALVVLLVWGVSKWSSAQDPNDIARDLASKSNNLQKRIQDDAPSDEDRQAIQPAEFIVKPQKNTPAKVTDFPAAGPYFDPTAQPNTKRENPVVFNVEEYQVDLTRSAMPGYDIIYDADNEPQIAVLTTKFAGKLDPDKINAAVKKLKDQGKIGKSFNKQLNTQPKAPPPAPAAGGPGVGMPGGMGGMGGSAGFGSGGMMGGPGGPYGMGGGNYDGNVRRNDDGKVIKYVPLKELDEAVTKGGNQPALTVIPVRLVTIHAVVPYKKQLEEIKRALRLTSDDEARQWGPWYDGFEIQRRESLARPDGKVEVIQEWAEMPSDPKSTAANYKFEEAYIDKIDTRKTGDHFEDGFLPYFLKPEMMLSMPLPLLAKDLNVSYPEIRLKTILDNIKKLEDASRPKVSASELLERLRGARPRNSIYVNRPSTVEDLGLSGQGGPRPGAAGGTGVPGPMSPGGPTPPRPGGSGGPPPSGGAPRPPEGFGAAGNTPTEVENFLLRFVDCDVRPGRTYEYRVRLRMSNPNFGQDKLVANPEHAKDNFKTLYSKWLQLTTPITVPAESFLYAFDTKTYRDQTEAAFAGQKELLKRFQLQDNQAVVEVATWMEQVRTDSGSKREPVGAWVVAEIPVGRGEFVGRKQYVKLPLWSSETQHYVLREVADKIVPPKGAKEAPQPKGWLVDFSTRSILVDFEGGRVKSRFNVAFDEKGNVATRTRTVEEDAATELLIVRPDGKLVVRNSRTDEADENRKEITSKWSEWLKVVDARRGPGGAGAGEAGEFMPKRP